ncbi:MAG: hypothetical protein L0332_13995 [Chloroflexi bacterium]|nr:hypothetical protein [Chloroflexota bacterium]MCI0578596.1 hypothetical protein [Chloroflexota bacterium]MCI0647355.1 hypothetical protein [Chloroflexota bacterium]MCI0727815.1 hypothetical protein [Chloroflexota bacterium]
MVRTVPSRANEEIALYIRTYYSLLRSSREVQIKSLIEAHTRIGSALHVAADEPTPDMAAFIYTILRLPACLEQVRLVIMGQSEQVFAKHGYPDVESWQRVGAPARRRRAFFDGRDTLAVYIASRSDIDDIIPILTAYQIERGKLRQLLDQPPVVQWLSQRQGSALQAEDLEQLAQWTGIPVDDLDRLRRIWQGNMAGRLLAIAQDRHSLAVRLLAGSLADYKRATNRWWQHVEDSLPEVAFANRPIYFISSNTHSMANLLSGYALQREAELVSFIESQGSADLQTEYQDILQQNVPSSRENFLYYTQKKYETVHPQARASRLAHEQQAGIRRVPSQHVFDIEVQVVSLNQLRPAWLDPRLRRPGIEALSGSEALIVNIDFPLGMAAYQVLSEIVRNVAEFRGVYMMGKAATLNGRIGDVMIASVVHDEQSLNTYLFNNCFTADDVAPHLVYGTVMDNQKAITALGTFLQNEEYMAVFYQEGYTVMEMEAGPYLSSIYEMIRPQRFPRDEVVNLYGAPFPIGVLHYASDTPFSKGKNLGSQNLSYFGMDPTYATMIAILRHILADEIRHVGV